MSARDVERVLTEEFNAHRWIAGQGCMCGADVAFVPHAAHVAAEQAAALRALPTGDGALANRRQAELVMHYVEGWLSNDHPAASRYLRECIEDIADQMVEDECATENPRTTPPAQDPSKETDR